MRLSHPYGATQRALPSVLVHQQYALFVRSNTIRRSVIRSFFSKTQVHLLRDRAVEPPLEFEGKTLLLHSFPPVLGVEWTRFYLPAFAGVFAVKSPAVLRKVRRYTYESCATPKRALGQTSVPLVFLV